MTPRHLILPITLLTLSALPSSALEVPSGGLRRDGIADLAPHPQPSHTDNEFWTYQFGLNDGLQVQLNFSRAEFGRFKDPVCGGDLSVMGFRGKNYFVAREYPLSNFSFEPGDAKLSVHADIFAVGIPPEAHRVFFSTRKNGISYRLDLTFTEMIPGAVWGDGVFHLRNDQQVGLFFHIPGAHVHGTLAINGDTTAVTGVGWMDHTYQTDFATHLIDHSYRYVTVAGPLEGGYLFQSGEGVFGYGVRNAGNRMVLLRPEAIRILDSGKGLFPTALAFTYDSGATTQFRVRADRQQTSAFQELNWLERKGAQMILGGELLSDRGTGWVNGNTPCLYSFIAVRR